MDSRTVLPVLAQYIVVLVPLLITLVIIGAGVAVIKLAAVYNDHVTDKRTRVTV